MRQARFVAVVAALASSLSDTAAAAPRAVSPRGMLVQQLAIAASDARSGVVMAGYRGTLPTARWHLLAKLGDRPAQRLGGSVFAPQIAVGTDGTAIAAWVAGRTLRAAIARPGHGFRRPRTLATAPRDVPAGSTGLLPGGIAVGRDGAGVIAWRHGDGPDAEVRVAFRRGDRFTAPSVLGNSFYAPAVARTPGGAFVVAWQTPPVMPPPGVPPTLEGNPRVMVAVAANGAFRAPTLLAGPPTFLVTPPSAVSGPGGAAVAWGELGAQRLAVLAGGGIDTGGLDAVRSNQTGHDSAMSVAVASDRSAVAVWRYVRTTPIEENLRVVGSQILAARRPAGGAFSTPEPLSIARRFAGEPQVAAVRGLTLATWTERAPRGGERLRVRQHDGRNWGAPVTVAAADAIGAVRLAAAGRSAALAWVARAGLGRGRVYLDDQLDPATLRD
jgi:hypothetical protein